MKAPKWKPAAGSLQTWHNWSSIRSTELTCNNYNQSLSPGLKTTDLFVFYRSGDEIHVGGSRLEPGGRLSITEGYNFLTEAGPRWGSPRPILISSPQLQSPPDTVGPPRGVCAKPTIAPIWFLWCGGTFSVSCIQICWPHQADKSESRCQVFNRFLRLITIPIEVYYQLTVVTFNSCSAGNIYIQMKEYTGPSFILFSIYKMDECFNKMEIQVQLNVIL